MPSSTALLLHYESTVFFLCSGSKINKERECMGKTLTKLQRAQINYKVWEDSKQDSQGTASFLDSDTGSCFDDIYNNNHNTNTRPSSEHFLTGSRGHDKTNRDYPFRYSLLRVLHVKMSEIHVPQLTYNPERSQRTNK